ncbi:MAG: hypothetical protein LBJ69_00090 [Holosporales bacterium]|nr:hypothetical protein [Holosporales bacterium]
MCYRSSILQSCIGSTPPGRPILNESSSPESEALLSFPVEGGTWPTPSEWTTYMV